ncbi:MAG TPA: tRNA (adenosine(37)-N6)-threonylcarbamoyltransferase complex dimerization subunit type 1 TsaB [Acidimicrobiales bacterium]|nr:tRNA (adenosine(37)-N6)-threonylcarbamoyltransferase complex dimerization subunit type 1 TsaB [Acidimicrobiales bacterium]
MIILGIDTATARVGCALGGYEGVLAEFHSTRGRRHAESLAPAISFVLAQARVEMEEVSAVAVDIGPGLFTGLRVGVATAKALAQARRVPMIGLSSLDLLAYEVRWTNRLIVPVIDARRGEVYYATYRQVPGGLQRLSPYRLCSPRDLSAELMATGEESLVIGDGAIRYAEALSADRRVELGTVGTAYPTAGSLVELAHPRAVREEFVHPSELEVLYLRKSDAEINWDRRQPAGESGWM